MNRVAKLVFSFLIIASLAGCSLPAQGENAPQGSILFQDDFSATSSGWETWNESSGSQVAYAGGGLRILVNEMHFDYWSVTGKRFGDVRIEADAFKLDGPDDNTLGLICRYQDRENFYALVMSSDGYAGILKVRDGDFKLISAAQMEYQQAINKGSASNRLRAVCLGSTLVLYINSQKAVQASDLDYVTGKVGVIAGSNEFAGTDILFDNFVVIRP